MTPKPMSDPPCSPLFCLLVIALAMLVGGSALASAQTPDPGAVPAGASGLPVPRFVSLKSDRVNLRTGPSQDFPTSWVLSRIGLPLEIIRELDGWRQVRDADGTTGWVSQSLLSGRRTALVLPWEVKAGQAVPEVVIRASNADSAEPVAKVEAGVLANIRSCDKRWCQITIGSFKGYIEQKKLWGVYDGEVVK